MKDKKIKINKEQKKIAKEMIRLEKRFKINSQKSSSALLNDHSLGYERTSL